MKKNHKSLIENKRVWLFSELVFSEIVKDDHEFKAGDKVEIQIMRVGKWNHLQYGEIKVNEKTLQQVKENFDENIRGVRLAVDENHEPGHKALGWFEELELRNDDKELFAEIKLTKKGAEILTDGLYRYFSPEIFFSMKDDETGKVIKNLLVGGAFTNRPFFKSMAPLMANEDAADLLPNDNDNSDISQSLLFFNSSMMKKFLELLGKFNEEKSISASEKKALTDAFGELPKEDVTDELTKMFNDVVAKFNDEDEDKKKEDEEKKKEEEEKKEDEDEDDDDDDEDEEDDEKVKANEDGSVTLTAIQFQELKETQKENAKLIREARKGDLSKKIGKFQFSEKNETGIVLPKSKKRIVNFAASLSEKQAEQFLRIMGDLKSVSASEIGKAGRSVDHDPKEKESVKELMGKWDFSEEEAKDIYKKTFTS